MNTGALVCGLIFAVVMIVVLAKTMDAKPKETQFNEDTDEL